MPKETYLHDEPGQTHSAGATSTEGVTDNFEPCHCNFDQPHHLSTCPYEGLDLLCEAGNALALTQRLAYEVCTLPAGHPEWTVNPATGYSYNHCNVEADSWWNDGGADA